MESKLNQILDEVLASDRQKILQDVTAHLTHILEHNSPKVIAAEIMWATAMYSLFDGLLDKIKVISDAASLVEAVLKEAEKAESRLQESVTEFHVPRKEDIN